MAVTIACLITALLARVLWVRWRVLGPARRQLESFLAARGVQVAQVRVGGHYGWPFYQVYFLSEAERAAFRASPAYAALLDEVQSMHPGLRRGRQEFSAEAAVQLWGQPRSTTQSQQPSSV